jgi:lipid-binding SYLF domain-containing protein
MRGLALVSSLVLSAGLVAADTAKERLQESASVISEIMATPDKGIPQDLFAKAQCIVIIPNLKKAAFVVGGEFGHGVAECRNASGSGWGSPAFVKLEGGSLGFQIGASSTDLVLLVMNRHGMDKLLEDKFTLGADASVAAGPVGRTAAAQTDLKLDAEILAWSRSKGLFAGVALKGAALHQDTDNNQEFYGHKMSNREIIGGNMAAPADARPLTSVLERYSSSRNSNADRVK